MAIFSKKLLKELFVTLLVHAMLLWIALVALLVFVAGDEGFGVAWFYLMLLGIIGCWGDECTLLFPFSNLLAVFAVLFFIARYARLAEYFIEAKKKFLIIYALVFLVVGIPIWFNVIRDYLGDRAYRKEYAADEAYYWNKYGTEEKVEASYSFISPINHGKQNENSRKANVITIINPDGIESRILRDLSGQWEDTTVSYVSPGGNYFIDTNTRDKKITKIVETYTQRPKMDKDINYYQYPDSCLWSSDENYILCQHIPYDLYDKKNKPVSLSL